MNVNFETQNKIPNKFESIYTYISMLLFQYAGFSVKTAQFETFFESVE